MEADEQPTAKRRQHLRVPVFPDEKEQIEANAKRAGVSVARYLRDVGQGYQIKGVMDYEYVRELVRGEWRPWPAGRLAQAMADRRPAHRPLRRRHDPCPAGPDRSHPGRNEPLMKSVVQPRAEP
jgi:hypothetical protein